MSITLITGPSQVGKSILAAFLAASHGGRIDICETGRASEMSRRINTARSVIKAWSGGAGSFIIDPLLPHLDSIGASIMSGTDIVTAIGRVEEKYPGRDIIIVQPAAHGMMPRSHYRLFSICDEIIAVSAREDGERVGEMVKTPGTGPKTFSFRIEPLADGEGRVGAYAKMKAGV